MSNRRQGASKMYQGAISTPSIKFWIVFYPIKIQIDTPSA